MASQTAETAWFTGTCDLRTEMKDNDSDLEGKRDDQNRYIPSSQSILGYLDVYSFNTRRVAVWPGL